MSEATDIEVFHFLVPKKTIKLDKLKVQKAKRVQVRAERKFRDIPGILPRPGHRRDNYVKVYSLGSFIKKRCSFQIVYQYSCAFLPPPPPPPPVT